MADLFAPQQNTRAPRREAERLKTLAESLQKGGQSKGNEMVSGIVVKQSPLEHLARGLQTAAGGYFEGQSRLKEEEDERALQQRMADALSQWGDPQAAAGILAQDPRTSEMAFKLMMGEQDHTRAKELAQMRISAMGSGGGNMPASMQVAGKMFALEQAMDNPNLSEKERYLAAREYDLIGQAQKTYGFDKGLGYSGGLSGYNKFRGQSPSQDILGITPIDMMPNGEMSYPQMGGQTPEFPLMPDQYTTLGQNKEFNDLIGGLTGQPMQQDPVAAHAQAVQLQQQQIGVSPMQRPELRSPVGMSPIQGYGEAAASIAAQKKAAEQKAALTQELEIKPQIEAAVRREANIADIDKTRLDSANENAGALQGQLSTFDQIENLINQGTLGNSPADRAAMAAHYTGLRQTPETINTANLMKLGNQLVLSRGSLGAGVSVADAERYDKAAGDFSKAQSNEERLQYIRTMRDIASKYAQKANQQMQEYRQGGQIPAYGQQAPQAQQPAQDINAEIESLERELGLR